MDTCDTGLVLLALLLTILHSWFAAAMTAAQNLGSQLGSLAEKQPKLLYYQKKELALQYGRADLQHGGNGNTGVALRRLSRLDSLSHRH